MMYLDANFFIFANLFDEKGTKAREILGRIIQGKRAITSSLSLDEVMWVLIKNNLRHEVRKIIEEIYATPNIEVKEVAATVPLRALDFMEKHNLKPRDAFHAAVMEYCNVKEIVSDDADFDKIKSIKRIGLQ